MFLILTAAAWTDIRKKRVSNRLVVFGLLVSFILNLVMYGWTNIIFFFIRILIPVLIFYLFFLMHVLGAGDIKLFSVICGFTGFWELAEVIFYSFLAGAVFSLIVLIRNHNLSARLMYVSDYIKTALITKSILRYDHESDGKQNVIPFSAAIFAGYFIYLLM